MGGSLAVIIAAELIIVAAVAYGLRRRAQPEDALADIGMVTLLAVLLSPIAAYFYFGLPSYPAAWASIPANNDTLGALILLALLLAQRLVPSRRSPQAAWD